MKEALGNWLQVNCKTEVPSYAMIRLMQVVLAVWRTKCTYSDEFSMTLKETTEEFSATFRGLLLCNLQRRLQKTEKLTQDDEERCMSLYSTMDALDVIDVGESDLVDLDIDTRSGLDSLKELNPELRNRFELFMIEHYPEIYGESPERLLKGAVGTVAGREAIRRKARAMTQRMTEPEKLQLVSDLLEEVGDAQALDKLLALKHVIAGCEGELAKLIFLNTTSNNQKDSRTVIPEDNDNRAAGLSSSYSTLANQLLKSDSVRRCSLICEIMEMILREKVC